MYCGFKNKLFLVIYHVANKTRVQVLYKHYTWSGDRLYLISM